MLIGVTCLSSNYELNGVLLDGLNSWLGSGRCLILRDFNSPTVDYKNLRTQLLENSFEYELVDAVITWTPVQHVKEATSYDPDFESS